MFRVSWKADGMRYMMLIDGEDEIYFFDRDNNIFKVEGLRFVHRKDIRRHLKDTLLDGVSIIFHEAKLIFIITFIWFKTNLSVYKTVLFFQNLCNVKML